MNYSEMSDYEISCEVGRAISFADYLLARSEQKNYCNSWADSGPIIQQNNISLLKCERMDSWVAGSSYWVDGAEWSVDWLSDDQNPLRAAMIVFLMMQEAK